MFRFQKTALTVLALLGPALLAMGCGGSDTVLGPQVQPEIVNQTDSFEFQATGAQNVTQTLSYTWANTGMSANVDQSCSINSGAGTIEIRDANNVTVYSGNLVDGGSYQSQTGTTGDWTIVVHLTQLSGTLNFRVQKLT